MIIARFSRLKDHRASASAILPLLLLVSTLLSAADRPWTEVPPSQWKGNTKVDVAGLKACAAAIAFPTKDAAPLIAVAPASVPVASGLYELRLTLRPSHVANIVAFHSGVRVKVADTTAAEFRGQFFSRQHQPEVRTTCLVHSQGGPLRIVVEAFTDAKACEKFFTAAGLKAGGPKLPSGLDAKEATELDTELELKLAPEKAVYYVLDRIELRAVSTSGHVSKLEINKIRYAPGETLKGTATLADVGGKGGDGVLNLYLEHGVAERTKIKSLPVKLAGTSQTVPFEIPLPKEELGYALVAEFVSAGSAGLRAGDADRSEAAEFFNIAADFNRVAIFGGYGGQSGTTRSEQAMQDAARSARAEYCNACEMFAWAEEDMVGMSPESDYWFSGQTCYHMNKQGMQQLIRIAHDHGIAMVSYGKFVMSGYIGWKTAYDFPNDHKSQYCYPVGMWEGINSVTLDRFRNKEFVPYADRPHIEGNRFDVWWQDFLPINPDATPRMSRIAAEAAIRSIDMFGWDGIRWDGQMRGGGPCGGSGGDFSLEASRRTQTLVRYFKEIVASKHPNFRHGYNYLLIQDKPSYDWAFEDYELDELCRGGGLLMNESIGNASAGRTFENIAQNLQVEGDLCRERGGYFLGISYAKSPRDLLIEGALWSAAGARYYGGVSKCFEAKRYCTRFSQYSFDERLRRLTTPEKVLAPQAETSLWWQPFVYETPLENGERQLVVNLLNIPRTARRPKDENAPPEWEMPAGSAPTTFALTLPNGLRAAAVNLIDPCTLAVTPVALKDNRFEVPPVPIWSVAVIDLAVEANAPSLASLFGPPKTFGVPRPNLKTERKTELVLDIKKDVYEVNKDMSALAPDNSGKQQEEQAALDALPWEERNARILKLREQNTREKMTENWWKGGSLPEDLKLQQRKFDFGNLAPIRNGRVDIFHARGAMDYRLRVPTAVAALDRFSFHDSPLMGGFRAGGGHWLLDGVPWLRYPEFDILVFTGIPHCAIGAENSYALVEYVKAGGAALFTGGEYAFGKGGYNYTVLERELLPVLCVENVDTRYSQTPLPLEAGPDFGELNAKVDFAAKPSFWVWNQVGLKVAQAVQPADAKVKVFLKSGDRPILVGWQVAKGRVACFLVDHRGKSEKDVTAFFDWPDWPVLLRSVLTWLAPDALSTQNAAAPALSAAEAKKILDQLEGDNMEDAAAGLEKDAPSSRPKSGDSLKKRVALIQRAIQCGSKEIAGPLAEQLATCGALPQDLSWSIIDFLRAQKPANLAEIARRCLASKESPVRGSGAQLLALMGDADFAKEITAPAGVLETNPQGYARDLVLALVQYAKPDLVEEGRKRVQAWNAREHDVMQKWTGGKGFSLAAPEHPCLDAEALFQRVAWLAYLTRHDPKTFGAQFARQWVMTAQYQDYCDRSARNLYSDHMTAADRKRAEIKGQEWQRFRAYFGRLRELTRSDAEALVKQSPELAAEGFCQAHFTLEFRTCMNLLGSFDRAATAGILEKLKKAENADLSEFAGVRAK
ncbi:MAG TPA: hypothetical protein VGP72_27345 [Planctomycetota bacterium]|jgi:hypothetical protein